MSLRLVLLSTSIKITSLLRQVPGATTRLIRVLVPGLGRKEEAINVNGECLLLAVLSSSDRPLRGKKSAIGCKGWMVAGGGIRCAVAGLVLL